VMTVGTGQPLIENTARSMMSQTCSHSEGEIGVTARSHLKLSLPSSEARTRLSRELYAPPPHRPPGCRWTCVRGWFPRRCQLATSGRRGLTCGGRLSLRRQVLFRQYCVPAWPCPRDFGDGPTSWADSWVADPTASGVSLALALTTGDTR
jgi:hypothetical protein